MAEYDDEEMGALDCEEIEGHINPQDSRVLKLADEFEREKNLGFKLGQEVGKSVRIVSNLLCCSCCCHYLLL